MYLFIYFIIIYLFVYLFIAVFLKNNFIDLTSKIDECLLFSIVTNKRFAPFVSCLRGGHE